MVRRDTPQHLVVYTFPSNKILAAITLLLRTKLYIPVVHDMWWCLAAGTMELLQSFCSNNLGSIHESLIYQIECYMHGTWVFNLEYKVITHPFSYLMGTCFLYKSRIILQMELYKRYIKGKHSHNEKWGIKNNRGPDLVIIPPQVSWEGKLFWLVTRKLREALDIHMW